MAVTDSQKIRDDGSKDPYDQNIIDIIIKQMQVVTPIILDGMHTLRKLNKELEHLKDKFRDIEKK